MKPMLSLILLMIISASSPSISLAQQNVTIYCDDDYAPYSFLSKEGKPQGIYVDILNKAFAKMDGYKVAIEAVPWKRGLKMLEDGTGFGIFPPYKRPKDRPWMDYSDPILNEKYAVMMLSAQTDKPRPNWPGDYFGLTLGKNAGFALPENDALKQAIKDGKIVIDESGSSEQNLLKLSKGSIAGYITDPIAAQQEWKKLLGERKVSGELVEAATISTEEGFLGVTNTDKGAFAFKADFLGKLNAILAEMKKNGEVQKIVDTYTK